MNINFDKFWEFLRFWSVGKIVVTLSLLVVLIKGWPDSHSYIGEFVSLGMMHEIFDLSHNKSVPHKETITDKDGVTSTKENEIKTWQSVMFNIFMSLALITMIGIILKILFTGSLNLLEQIK